MTPIVLYTEAVKGDVIRVICEVKQKTLTIRVIRETKQKKTLTIRVIRETKQKNTYHFKTRDLIINFQLKGSRLRPRTCMINIQLWYATNCDVNECSEENRSEPSDGGNHR